MSSSFWVRRFLTVFACALVIISAAQFAKTNDVSHALTQGLVWAFASAVLFTAARIWQSRRGQHCAICKDTPEMAMSATASGSPGAPSNRADQSPYKH